LPEVSIRKAGPADAALVSKLGRSSFYEAFAEETTPEDMTEHLQRAFKVEDIQKQLDDDRSPLLLIEVDADPAGYALLYPDNPPNCVTGPDPIQLVRFYLRRDYYGRNIGNRLMEACLLLAFAEGYRSIWLSSWEQNHRANAFYKKWGFEIVGAVKFKVGNDIQDDHIFLKKLSKNSTWKT